MSLPPDVLNLITGAGGMGAIMWLWLTAEKKERSAIARKLEEGQDRERLMTKQVIEALILNKRFLEDHRLEIENLGVKVADEVAKILAAIERAENVSKE